MKKALLILMFSLVAYSIRADYRHVDFDASRNFSTFKTFVIRDGSITNSAPELNSWFTRKQIADAIRAQLTAKGLTEAQGRPDIVVMWELGAMNGRGVQEVANARGNLRNEIFDYKQVTLTIELTASDSRSVWRGVYRDNERNPSKLANNLPGDIKKLFADFPPRKK